MAGYRGVEPESGLEVSQPRLGMVDTSYRHLHHNDKEPAPVLTPYDNSRYEEEHGASRRRTSRNPFGLSPLAFGVLVALITAIILGAALGGGLGSAINSSSKDARYV